MTTDVNGREYAKVENVKAGDILQVDGDFEGCFVPWSKLKVHETKDGLALMHNAPECGACGGDNLGEDCPHLLEGQIDPEGYLIGMYPT